MSTGSIKVTAVEKRQEGASDEGRPWSLWHVHSESGVVYATFDGVVAHRAFEAVGQRAVIEYRPAVRGHPLLTSIAIEREAAA